MAVLYRKYRPQTFADVLGQKYIVQTLQNQVAAGSPAHAYLFTGSRGVGKTSVARILAKAVNCTSRPELSESNPNDPKGDACGKCDVCLAVERGNFIDLVEIDAASNTGVDNIRDLIDHVKFSPSLGKYKVFIIDEVHMLSKGAFNALLKTLEEPPAHAIFVLATTEINKVPVTIISRTQRFDFKRLSAQDLEEQLAKIIKQENAKLDKSVVELIAQNAEGSVRDALTLLDKVLTLGDSPSVEDSRQLLGITDLALSEQLLKLIGDSQASDIPGFFDTLLEQGQDFLVFNRDFLEYLRKALIYKVNTKESFALDEQHLANLQSLTEKLSINELVLFTRLFLKSFKDLNDAPSPQIPLLLASLEAVYRKPANGATSKNYQNIQNHESVPANPLPTQPKVVSQTQVEPQGELVKVQLSSEEVQKFWPEVLSKIKNLNSPLAQLLRNAQLEGCQDGHIVLGVKFLFHKQNLENQKNRQLICNVLKEVSGHTLGLSARVIKETSADGKRADPAMVLTDALKIFGGELIE